MKKVYFHRRENGWFYFAIESWQPFKFLMHGGWACLDLKWLWRYLFVVPKQRSWRWG